MPNAHVPSTLYARLYVYNVYNTQKCQSVRLKVLSKFGFTIDASFVIHCVCFRIISQQSNVEI